MDQSKSKVQLINELQGLRQQIAKLKLSEERLARADKSLQESEERLAKAEEVAHLGTWEMDIETGASVWSDEFFRLCGLQPGSIEPTAEEGFKLIHPDDRERASQEISRAITARDRYDIQKRIVRPDGSIRYVQSIGQVICNETGDPMKLMGSFLDITEQKLAEKALNRRATHLVLLTETARELSETFELKALVELTETALKERLDYHEAKIILFQGVQPQSKKASTLILSEKEVPTTPIRSESQAKSQSGNLHIKIPIKSGEHLLGMLSVKPPEFPSFSENDKNILRILAEHLAVCIENTNLFDRVDRMAATDPLTGIFNRRKLMELGTREFITATRYKHPLAAIMIDIDHFKMINDTFGHITGDEVLKHTAKTIFYTIRDADLFGRYGGDEFAILLPQTTLEDAEHLRERINHAINKQKIHAGKTPIQIKLSVGIACLTPQMKDLQSLISQADQALYKAKESGRNQINSQGDDG